MDYVFFSLLTSSVCTFCSGLLVVLYKSKCTRIEGCGVVILRDVVTEEKYDEINTASNARL